METSWRISQKRNVCQIKRTNRGFMTIWKYFLWRKKFYPNKPLKIQIDLLSIWLWTMQDISSNLLKVKLQIYLFSSSSILEPSICQMSSGAQNLQWQTAKLWNIYNVHYELRSQLCFLIMPSAAATAHHIDTENKCWWRMPWK